MPLSKCPSCGGPADNGHDREFPPNPYLCTRCSKPLFIPLRREFYEAFRDGTKTEEFRRHGARWNAATCRVGRQVVLSLGYGKRNRMAGVIAGFEVRHEPTTTDAWVKCYGETNEFTHAACIHITNLKPMEALCQD